MISDLMHEMTLIELIEAYGAECVYGGQGASSDNSEEYLEEIKRRLAAGEVE
jgi:hypothetical protein